MGLAKRCFNIYFDDVKDLVIVDGIYKNQGMKVFKYRLHVNGQFM